MSKVTIIRLVDDLDGTLAAETVHFSLDGVPYEIDLTTAHAAELRAALAPYIAAGSCLTTPGGRKVSVRRLDGNGKDPDEPKRIREWWLRNERNAGLPAYKAKGKLHGDVVKAYRKFDGRPVPPPTAEEVDVSKMIAEKIAEVDAVTKALADAGAKATTRKAPHKTVAPKVHPGGLAPTPTVRAAKAQMKPRPPIKAPQSPVQPVSQVAGGGGDQLAQRRQARAAKATPTKTAAPGRVPAPRKATTKTAPAGKGN